MTYKFDHKPTKAEIKAKLGTTKYAIKSVLESDCGHDRDYYCTHICMRACNARLAWVVADRETAEREW